MKLLPLSHQCLKLDEADFESNTKMSPSLELVHMELDSHMSLQPGLLKLCQLLHPSQLQGTIMYQMYCGCRDCSLSRKCNSCIADYCSYSGGTLELYSVMQGARLLATIHYALRMAFRKGRTVNLRIDELAELLRGMNSSVGLLQDDTSHASSGFQACLAKLQEQDVLFDCIEHNVFRRCFRLRCQRVPAKDDKYASRALMLQEHRSPKLDGIGLLRCLGPSSACHEIKIQGRLQKRCSRQKHKCCPMKFVRAAAIRSFRTTVVATCEERQSVVERLKSLPLELAEEHIWPRVHELRLSETLEQVRKAGHSEFEDLPDLIWMGDVIDHSETNDGTPGWSRRVTEVLSRVALDNQADALTIIDGKRFEDAHDPVKKGSLKMQSAAIHM